MHSATSLLITSICCNFQVFRVLTASKLQTWAIIITSLLQENLIVTRNNRSTKYYNFLMTRFSFFSQLFSIFTCWMFEWRWEKSTSFSTFNWNLCCTTIILLKKTYFVLLEQIAGLVLWWWWLMVNFTSNYGFFHHSADERFKTITRVFDCSNEIESKTT